MLLIITCSASCEVHGEHLIKIAEVTRSSIVIPSLRPDVPSPLIFPCVKGRKGKKTTFIYTRAMWYRRRSCLFSFRGVALDAHVLFIDIVFSDFDWLLFLFNSFLAIDEVSWSLVRLSLFRYASKRTHEHTRMPQKLLVEQRSIKCWAQCVINYKRV